MILEEQSIVFQIVVCFCRCAAIDGVVSGANTVRNKTRHASQRCAPRRVTYLWGLE